MGGGSGVGAACAAVGAADEAFRLVEQMKLDRVRMDGKACTALIDACGAAIKRIGPSRRREQLVLLERASAVLERARQSFAEADPGVWNALITAAARSYQLQRAFQILEDMQVPAPPRAPAASGFWEC
jgi:PPR repeat